jgi:hypothetical protein
MLAAGHRGLAGRPGGPHAGLAGRPHPAAGLGGRLEPPDRGAPGRRVRSAGPGHRPGRLALAGLAWAWRNYAVTAGLAGMMASASITFDTRQWNRQARTALGVTRAPGAVPLLARGARIPVGGTIRAIGHRWHPVFTIPGSACARHMVIVGSTGSGKTNLMIRLWAGWFAAALQAWRAAAAGGAGLQGRPGRPQEGRPDPPPAARRGRPPGRHLAR